MWAIIPTLLWHTFFVSVRAELDELGFYMPHWASGFLPVHEPHPHFNALYVFFCFNQLFGKTNATFQSADSKH